MGTCLVRFNTGQTVASAEYVVTIGPYLNHGQMKMEASMEMVTSLKSE